MKSDYLLNHLLELLDERSVHLSLEETIDGIPFEYWGKRVRGLPYTLFDLLEHIRLSIADILQYINDPNYEMGNWPEDYWPKKHKPTNQKDLQDSINFLYSDIKKLRKMVKKNHLLKPLEYGDKKHTLTREVLILCNHTSYHLGQIIILRRLLKIW